jgi:hypothetical protein
VTHPTPLRPKWYQQRPSDRIRRLIDRVSRGKVIRFPELEDLCRRYANKMLYGAVGSLPQSVYRGYVAVVNGRWITSGNYTRLGSHFIDIVREQPVSQCRWCGAPLFHPEHSARHYYCRSRLCRELSAVLHNRHGCIKIRMKHWGGEAGQIKFMAMFYIKKHKEKCNAPTINVVQ